MATAKNNMKKGDICTKDLPGHVTCVPILKFNGPC